MRLRVHPFPHCQPPEPAAPLSPPGLQAPCPRGPGAGAGPGESQLHIRTGILRRQPRRRRRAGPDCLRTAPEGSPLPSAGRMGKQQRREGTAQTLCAIHAHTRDPFTRAGCPRSSPAPAQSSAVGFLAVSPSSTLHILTPRSQIVSYLTAWWSILALCALYSNVPLLLSPASLLCQLCLPHHVAFALSPSFQHSWGLKGAFVSPNQRRRK